jgi:hypothetical protein
MSGDLTNDGDKRQGKRLQNADFPRMGSLNRRLDIAVELNFQQSPLIGCSEESGLPLPPVGPLRAPQTAASVSVLAEQNSTADPGAS